MDKKQWFRSIPNMNGLLEEEKIQKLSIQYGRELVKDAINQLLDELRKEIAVSENEEFIKNQIQTIHSRIEERVTELDRPNIRRVINGTGTILHTNLGRAPISEAHLAYLTRITSGYSNLEYDLEAGGRGERYSHFEKLLCQITGAEAAMAVNNNASSVLLILSALAGGGETIVSRGELIEIGGKFRIPDVCTQSGTRLVEIGTTNKTHLEDYANAITEDTKAILKVHTSNYRIVGFTASVDAGDLRKLCTEKEIPLIEDMGSGALIDLEKYGLRHEPTIQEAIQKGVDVVCFSGDKLLGGPQAGIIVGRRNYIEKLKKYPLTRALRIDKFTVTALEMTLHEYLSTERAEKNIPVLQMLSKTQKDLLREAEELCAELNAAGMELTAEVVECNSQMGGGSLPLEEIPSIGVAILPRKISVDAMEKRLRHLTVPIFGRIVNDRFLLDLRTIRQGEAEEILQELKTIFG